MARLHHKGSSQPESPVNPLDLLAAIEAFLATCRTPAVVEFGDPIFALKPDSYTLELRSDRVWLEFWNDAHSISRRILSAERGGTGCLDCTIHRFGGKPGKLSFIDLDRPQTAHKTTAANRRNFGEQFRRMLFRQFPGWEIGSLSAAQDLQRSFSSIYPRARLVKGNRQIAALACSTAQDEASFLTYALIWHDYLKTRADEGTTTALALFLPEAAGILTAHRLHWMTGSQLSCVMHRFNSDGMAGVVDPQDLGNLQTRVASHLIRPKISDDLHDLLQTIANRYGVGLCPELGGNVSIRYRGLEFGRVENGQLLLGIDERRPVSHPAMQAVQAFLSELDGLTALPANGSRSLISTSERWLETCVRRNIPIIDSTLIPDKIHGQVITFAASDRDLIDLLAISTSGRLTVIELKASEDIQLPMQALDYWMRVAWHAQKDELSHLYPGASLDSRPPRLLLIAPAMSFHSTNATILRYFSSAIEVERIGVNSDWRHELKVVLRLSGAAAPISHGSSA